MKEWQKRGMTLFEYLRWRFIPAPRHDFMLRAWYPKGYSACTYCGYKIGHKPDCEFDAREQGMLKSEPK